MRALILAGFTAVVLAAPSAAQVATPGAQAHIEAARRAAGPRWSSRVDGLCGLAGSDRPDPSANAKLPVTLPEVANWPEPPAKIFDNLNFVGSKGVSAFAIDTPDGIIVTDAMWAYDAEKSVAGGLAALGLDPHKIRYVIIPHGHPDHYGGAQLLHDKYGAKIVAPRADLETIKIYEKRDTTPIPKGYDLLVGGGDQLTLGGTTVTFHDMPGHTPGGVVLSFPVTRNGEAHRMLIWAAGGATPPSDDKRRAQIPALRRLVEQARALGIDALGDNHGSHGPAREVRESAGASNPFVVGREGVVGYLTMRLECDLAQTGAGA